MVTFMLCKQRKRQIEEITLQKIPFQVTGEAGNLQIWALHKNAVEVRGFLLTLPASFKKYTVCCFISAFLHASILPFTHLVPSSAIRDKPVTQGSSLAGTNSHSSIGFHGAGVCAGWRMVPLVWTWRSRVFSYSTGIFDLVFCSDRNHLWNFHLCPKLEAVHDWFFFFFFQNGSESKVG